MRSIARRLWTAGDEKCVGPRFEKIGLLGGHQSPRGRKPCASNSINKIRLLARGQCFVALRVFLRRSRDLQEPRPDRDLLVLYLDIFAIGFQFPQDTNRLSLMGYGLISVIQTCKQCHSSSLSTACLIFHCKRSRRHYSSVLTISSLY